MIDAKTDLLTTLLKCGTCDIDRLIYILNMGNELFDDNILADVIDEYGSGIFCNFNILMYYLMNEITCRLVSELDQDIKNEKDRYIYIIDNYWEYPCTNYMDSHFQLDCLDEWVSGTDRNILLEKLKIELLEMKKNGD